MKKALSFAVALGLVAGAVSMVSAADLSITGDARWRGSYQKNNFVFPAGVTSLKGYEDYAVKEIAAGRTPADIKAGSNNENNTEQQMDQRYRMNMGVKVNDDVSVNTRLVFGDQLFGGALGDSATANPLKLNADRANMVINTLGGTWTIGRQEAAWGNAALPYAVKDVSVDRVKGIYKAGDMTFGAYLQQDVEGQYDNGDGDKTTWGALVVGKAGDAGYGLLLNYTTSDNNSAKASGKDTGYLVDPYFNAKIGPATVLGELLYQGGDLNKDNADNNKVGGFVAAVVDLAPVTVTGVAAYAKNGSTADSHFAPTMLIGSTNETSKYNFGALSDDSAYLVGAVVGFKASDKLSLGATLGYVKASKENKMSVTEVDVTAEYELAKNAKYKFGVAYGKPKNIGDDDNIIVVGNAVEVAW